MILQYYNYTYIWTLVFFMITFYLPSFWQYWIPFVLPHLLLGLLVYCVVGIGEYKWNLANLEIDWSQRMQGKTTNNQCIICTTACTLGLV